MQKIRNFLNDLSKEELEQLERSMQSGTLNKLVEKRLRDMNAGLRVCPVCSSDVGHEAFVLIFGPQGLRKKAAFCAHDCLEYFIGFMKKETKEERK
tara:strand:- start:2865 stop:3152 length:288 start_codon:yes stop_codon:yes gene_type:complete